MTELSLMMIVRNEVERLEQVLADAASFCDEVVVVDTGSTDGTAQLARSLGATVVDFVWRDDFAAARNEAIRHARGNWGMYLDGDDRVPPASQQAFRQLKVELRSPVAFDLVQVPYRYAFSPPDSEVCAATFPVGRVWRLGRGLQFTQRVHEYIEVPADRQIFRADCYVDHRPPTDRVDAKSERNLRILGLEIAEGDTSIRTASFYANELRRKHRFEEARAAFAALLARPLEPLARYGALLDLASCLTETEPDRALALVREAAGIDPTRADALVRLGLHHYAKREWAAALPYFEAAERCEPPLVGAHNEVYLSWLPSDCRAICLGELGRYEEAIEATLAAFPGNPEPDRLRANVEYFRSRLEAEHDRIR